MKRILQIGAIGLMAMPIITAVSCSKSSKDKDNVTQDVKSIVSVFDGVTIVNSKTIKATQTFNTLTQDVFNSWGGTSLKADNTTPFVFPTNLKGTTIKYKVLSGNPSSGISEIIIKVSKLSGTQNINLLGSIYTTTNKTFSDKDKAEYVASVMAESAVTNIKQDLPPVTTPTPLTQATLQKWNGEVYSYNEKEIVHLNSLLPSNTFNAKITYTTNGALSKTNNQVLAIAQITVGTKTTNANFHLTYNSMQHMLLPNIAQQFSDLEITKVNKAIQAVSAPTTYTKTVFNGWGGTPIKKDVGSPFRYPDQEIQFAQENFNLIIEYTIDKSIAKAGDTATVTLTLTSTVDKNSETATASFEIAFS